MAFAFLSWNVRKYRGNPNRLQRVVNTIAGFSPEPQVFGLIEFEAKQRMRELMLDYFPDYDFGVTDSRQGVELMLGWRRGFFSQVIFSQKRDFRRSQFLRPGGLVSVLHRNRWYNLLFLHMDSGAAPTDYGNRRTTFRKIWNLQSRLRQIPEMNNNANLIVLGDLNTMGNGGSIDGVGEIRRMEQGATANGMRVLRKEFDETWHQWGRGPRNSRRRLRVSDLPTATRSNLDHVIASNELRFQRLTNAPDGSAAHVFVQGWQQEQGNRRVDFLWEVSDHCALYGFVQ